MIQDQKQISIKATPEKVFDLIDTMPNKFPVYEIMETKPFLFLRMLLVDGMRTAINTIRMELPSDTAILNLGDSIGPFKLSEAEKPSKYLFTLKSFFFNCQTGYKLSSNENNTTLSFVLVASKPRVTEKLYWFFVKPIHSLLAKKVLKVIRDKAEEK